MRKTLSALGLPFDLPNPHGVQWELRIILAVTRLQCEDVGVEDYPIDKSDDYACYGDTS